jgi:outer membrane protein assembly factor BamB
VKKIIDLIVLIIGLLAITQMIPFQPQPKAKASSLHEATPPPIAANASNDWPMLAANPQRTSWTPEEVRGNLNVEWYRPIEPYIPYKIQPIAANDKLYISTARGLYTFSATNGNLLWVYPTELPLGHSPTIATLNGQSIAFVGGYDRKIHAIDANSGQAISGYTPYVAAAGFETNPLVINNTIYAGNRDGYFYALDAVTGNLQWRYKTDGPILFSAAYKSGVLYFASNDAYAYAIDATNGSLIWKSQKLLGAGFHSYWPVIYTEKATGKDYIIFSSGENYRTDTQNSFLIPQIETNTLFGSIPVGNVIGPTSTNIPGDWAAGTVVMDAGIITNYYQNRPDRRTVFVLNAGTGQEFTFDSNGDGKPEYAPFTWSGVTHAGSKYPPVINGVDGVYYQGTAYYSGGWVSRGGPVGWKFGTKYISRVDGNSSNGHASDEPMAYSSGGKLIYYVLCCDREAGAMDVTIPFGQPNRAWQYFGYNLANNALAPGYQQMYNAGDTAAYNDENGWQLYSGKNKSKNGVYGKHSNTQSPPIPYQGKLFMLKGNALLAFSPTGSNPKTPLPLATIVSTQNASPPPTKTELAQRLETEVQKMLTAGPLRPGYHSSGFFDLYGNGGYTDERTFGEIFDYFQNPADTVYTLLLAYPHLSPTTQQQVKTYLQTYYGPGKPYDFTRIVHIGWGTGAAREPFVIPSDMSSWWGKPYTSPYNPSTEPICGWCGYWQHFPPFSFYGAWKYAQIVGNNNPAFAKNIFDQMSNKLEAPLSDNAFIKKPYWLNQYIAGYKGYLELQKLAGYAQNQSILTTYQRLLNLRVNSFSKDTPYAPTLYGGDGWEESHNNAFAVARNFMFLTPELADYLNQHIYSQIQTAVNEYEYVAPYWFVPKFDNSYGEATFQHLYDSPALFQAKAYILKQPYDELVKWLDVPAFYRGDLFYIQNLAAALTAPGAGFSLNVTPPIRYINTGGTAEYTIQVQHSSNFTETVTLQIGNSPSSELVITPPAQTTFPTPGGQTILTLTDQHDPSFSEGVWYTVSITATGGEFVRTANISLLVNGKQAFLPVILK